MDFHCPNCNKEYDSGNYPDHWRDIPQGGTFDFYCAVCDVTFDVEVDWVPEFYVKLDSVRKGE